MTLGDFEIIPGVVISNSDPKNQGRVKAVAPGLFDTSTMSEEDLFWINPFMMIGYQSFSKMEISSKIWILHNKKNYFEYWYIPMFEINEHSPAAAIKTDSDIMLSRSIGGETVQMYYSRDNGFVISIGDNKVNLLPGGAFKILANGAEITADSDGITLSKKDAETYAATKAEPLIALLTSQCNWLMATGTAALLTPFTAALGASLISCSVDVQSQLQSIKSNFVKIS